MREPDGPTRRRRGVRRAAAILAIGMMLASCSARPAIPVPTPGALAGVVIDHPSGSGAHPGPLGRALVEVYRQAVSPGGPIMLHPPRPVATARTDRAGVFVIRGLPGGRWFVVVMNAAGAGSWVRYDPARGAVVTLVVCSDCPMPL